MLMRCLPKGNIVVVGLCTLVLALAGFSPALAGSSKIRESNAGGEGVETHLPADEPMTPWIHDPRIFTEKEGAAQQEKEGNPEGTDTEQPHEDTGEIGTEVTEKVLGLGCPAGVEEQARISRIE